MGAHLLGCSQSGAKSDPTEDFLNPLRDPWPKAPSMRVYCMYGVGSAAERNYHYHHLDSTKVCISSSPMRWGLLKMCNFRHLSCITADTSSQNWAFLQGVQVPQSGSCQVGGKKVSVAEQGCHCSQQDIALLVLSLAERRYICNLKTAEQQFPASCTCLKPAVLDQA